MNVSGERDMAVDNRLDVVWQATASREDKLEIHIFLQTSIIECNDIRFSTCLDDSSTLTVSWRNSSNNYVVAARDKSPHEAFQPDRNLKHLNLLFLKLTSRRGWWGCQFPAANCPLLISFPVSCPSTATPRDKQVWVQEIRVCDFWSKFLVTSNSEHVVV